MAATRPGFFLTRELSLSLVSASWTGPSTPWTVALQAPLSMGFFRQESQSGLPFLLPGDPPDPGIEPTSLALAGKLFITEPAGKPKDSSHTFVKTHQIVPLTVVDFTFCKIYLN